MFVEQQIVMQQLLSIYVCILKKKKKRSSQQMVSEQLALGFVRKADKRKLRDVLEFKDNKRAVGS